MSEISSRIRAYVNDPSVSDYYGEWGALRPDQRRQIRKLCDTCDIYEQAADRKQAEVAREIFEEIEKVTARVYNDFMFNREGVGMKATYVVEFSDELDIAIAELKKKYTEGGE